MLRPWWRGLAIVLAGALALALAVWFAMSHSPWPVLIALAWVWLASIVFRRDVGVTFWLALAVATVPVALWLLDVGGDGLLLVFVALVGLALALPKPGSGARWAARGTPGDGEAELHFEGNQVSVGERRWDVPYPVSDLLRIGGSIIVLYDYMSGPRHQQFRNLEGFAPDGRRLWTAKQPTTETADSYVAISDRDGLTAWSFASYLCKLNPKTGRLLSREFTK
jgi:hypothetical protein